MPARKFLAHGYGPAGDARRYDSATITVLLDGRHTFTCEVQDWDFDDKPLSDDEAYRMAEGLIMRDSVELYGQLDGVDCVTAINPERVIALYVTATGITNA